MENKILNEYKVSAGLKKSLYVRLLIFVLDKYYFTWGAMLEMLEI